MGANSSSSIDKASVNQVEQYLSSICEGKYSEYAKSIRALDVDGWMLTSALKTTSGLDQILTDAHVPEGCHRLKLISELDKCIHFAKEASMLQSQSTPRGGKNLNNRTFSPTDITITSDSSDNIITYDLGSDSGNGNGSVEVPSENETEASVTESLIDVVGPQALIRMPSEETCQLIECPMCLMAMEDPITLMCGHSGCLTCFQEAFKQSQKCVVCRASVPSEIRRNLKVNITLKALIKRVRLTRLSRLIFLNSCATWEEKAEAAEELTGLALECDDKRIMAALGVIPVLVNMIIKSDPHNSKNKNKFSKMDLFHLTALGEQTDELQVQACACLAMLIDNHEDNMHILVNAGGVENVLDLLSVPLSPSPCPSPSLSLPSLSELSVISTVTSASASASVPAPAKEHAALILRNLARNDQYKTMIVDKGAIKILLNMMRASTSISINSNDKSKSLTRAASVASSEWEDCDNDNDADAADGNFADKHLQPWHARVELANPKAARLFEQLTSIIDTPTAAQARIFNAPKSALFIISDAGYADINGYWGIDPLKPEYNGRPMYKKLLADGVSFKNPGNTAPGTYCLGWTEVGRGWMFFNCGENSNDWPYNAQGIDTPIPPVLGWVRQQSSGVTPMPIFTWTSSVVTTSNETHIAHGSDDNTIISTGTDMNTDTMKFNACQALYNIAWYNFENKLAISEAGGIVTVLELIQGNSASGNISTVAKDNVCIEALDLLHCILNHAKDQTDTSPYIIPDAIIQALIAAHVVDILIEFIKNGTSTQNNISKEKAVYIIAELSKNETMKIAFKNNRDISYVPILLELAFTGTDKAKEMASIALQNLITATTTANATVFASGADTSTSALFNSKCVPVLVEAIPSLIELVKIGSIDAVKEGAIGMLAILSENSANKYLLYDAGIIPLLLDVCLMGTTISKEKATYILMNIAGNSDTMKKHIDSAGGVSVLLSLIKFPSSEACQEHAAGALMNLAYNSGIKKVINSNNDGIPALVEVVFCGTATAKMYAAGTLWNMANNNIENKEAIFNAGAIPVLVELAKATDADSDKNAGGSASTAACTVTAVTGMDKAVGALKCLASGTDANAEKRIEAMVALGFQWWKK